MASADFVRRNYKSLIFVMFVAFVIAAGFTIANLQAEPGTRSSRTTVDVNSQSARKGASSEDSVKSGASLQQDRTDDSKNSLSQEVELNVNGEDVPVPENGSVHKEFSSNDGNTSIDLNVNSSSSGESQSTSRSSIRLHTDSSSSSTYRSNSNVNIENGEVSQ